MADLVAIVPSRGRPEAIAELISTFQETCTADTALLVAVNNDDERLPEYQAICGPREAGSQDGWVTRVPGSALLVTGNFRNMVEALNGAAEHAARGDRFAVAFMGDDHRPRTVGWDQAYLDALRDLGTGIVYGNDLLQGENLPTQVAMTADIVRALGWMAPPDFRHLFVDNVWKVLGTGADCLRYLPDVVVEHLHPLAGKAEWTEGHLRVNSSEVASHDEQRFRRWLDQQAAADIAAVRALWATADLPAGRIQVALRKRVISFSVFGPDRTYSRGAIANARLAADLYPDWTCRFYVGDSVDANIINELAALPNVEIVWMRGRPEDWSALFWRFYSLNDDSVDAHLFRDADSRPDEREAAAVAQWLNSGAQFHIMRDHPEHRLPVMAGLWGATKAGAARLAPLLPDLPQIEHSYVDQVWLRDVAYPVMATSLCLHRDAGETLHGEQPRGFPVPRAPLPGGGYRFVGQAFDADDQLRHPRDAHRVGPVEHEWRLFDPGTVPEYTTAGWYADREHAPHLEEGHRPRLEHAAALVAQAALAKKLRTVVDLGAGDGGLLSLLGPALATWGYDLMPANVTAAKERGVDVRYGDVLTGDVEWAQIVCCTEVLEHLVDPHAFVRDVFSQPRVQALVCSSPWDERPGSAYEYHAWAWDLEGYRALLEQAGFRVQRQRQVGRFQVVLAVRP